MQRRLPAKTLILFALMLQTTIWSHSLVADDVIKQSPQGGINWTQGVIFANGFGTAKPDLQPAQRKLLAQRAAIVDAQRNLLEITQGVRITSELTTDQAMKQSRETSARIVGIIKGAQVTSKHYQNEVASVTLSMPIAGRFLKSVWQNEASIAWQINHWPLLLSTVSFEEQLGSIGNHLINGLIPSAHAASERQNSPNDAEFIVRKETDANAYRRLVEWIGADKNHDIVELLNRSIAAYENNSQFSGLLIDATNVPDFELASIPKIRNQSGEILYPNADTSYDDIVKNRGVTYDFDLNDAIANQRVATKPFIIKALATYENLTSDLIISTKDGERIKQSLSTLEAMNKAGVLIVVPI